MRNAMTIANRRLPIPNAGDFGSSGCVVFDSTVIRVPPPPVQMAATGPPPIMIQYSSSYGSRASISCARRSLGAFRLHDRTLVHSYPVLTSRRQWKIPMVREKHAHAATVNVQP